LLVDVRIDFVVNLQGVISSRHIVVPKRCSRFRRAIDYSVYTQHLTIGTEPQTQVIENNAVVFFDRSYAENTLYCLDAPLPVQTSR
jgi:hypothetical protein